MGDAGAMGAVERVRNLDGDRCRGFDRKRRSWRSAQPIGQRFTLEVLEDEIVEVAVAADVVERADMGIVERGDGPRFLLETAARFGLGRERAGEDLDGDGAV